MSEIKINPNNQTINQVQPATVGCMPSYATAPILPTINNYNGFVPTYIPSYYTGNYGYQMPCCYNQYPAYQQPRATIQTGGATYQVPQGANGVNIIVNSPTVATPGSHPMINTNTNCAAPANSNNGSATATATATATTPQKPNKTKNIVAITDDYVKNLENYLRSPNKDLKTYAIQEIAKRFEEDESRRTNQPLNALLNLALQAKEPQIRFVALSLLTTGLAGGNDTTVQLLNNMQQSRAFSGQEANDVKKALLKMSETVVKVPDYSTNEPKKSKGDA